MSNSRIELPLFKIRCSSIGIIMGLKGLSKTGETYLKEWAKSQIYKRKKQIISKYLTKGIIMEDTGIEMIGEHLCLGMIMKNEQQFENDFIKGTPDVLIKDMVIDNKNSWDEFTFPLFDTSVPNSDYYWQLQGYMAVCVRSKAILAYTLTDMPEHLINAEAWRYCNQYGHEHTEKIFNKFKDMYTYNDIPDDLKIKCFEIDRNDNDIDRIKERVLECRAYLEQLKF